MDHTAGYTQGTPGPPGPQGPAGAPPTTSDPVAVTLNGDASRIVGPVWLQRQGKHLFVRGQLTIFDAAYTAGTPLFTLPADLNPGRESRFAAVLRGPTDAAIVGPLTIPVDTTALTEAAATVYVHPCLLAFTAAGDCVLSIDNAAHTAPEGGQGRRIDLQFRLPVTP